MREYLAALEGARERPDPGEVPERFRGWLSPSIYGQNLVSLAESRIIDG
jgi:hypothetical protein